MIIVESLERLNGVSHAFFTRQGGVSAGVYASLNCGPGSNDDIDDVTTNRTRALAGMGLAGACLLTADQIHSSTVITADRPWGKKGAPKADGIVTKIPRIALGVLTADCAPVLFADAEAQVIGAAHAGWRGAKSGILEATVEAMCGLGADAGNIVCAVGPCIGAKSYEVGKEFFAGFMDDDPKNRDHFSAANREDHYLFDLSAYVAKRLLKLGLRSVDKTAADTFADKKRFFSYRRAALSGEENYGRMLSAIALTG
ncbi:MAG: polyphenol oxidase [Rhodospirillales bacterium RIFCSPLOWO2_12_FULL_58_28]|nr:MAG: polyphenol oxidase [Rhodospirillales bacterium RIFCSPLOWO2_02_FULL_58_16]OHC77803.1 MAG: polyphenol oxidase [Rhodospirillales bacterium RIFCSPLOWO2_12_FULL_58_28]